MTNQSVTRRVDFNAHGTAKKVLSVNADVDSAQALGIADALYESVLANLTDCVTGNDMDAKQAILNAFAMEAAYALREAAGVAA